MPYSKANPPKHVGKLPEAAMALWIGAFNGAYDFAKNKPEKDREAYANQVAWSALKKNGWGKSGSGAWVKNKSEIVEMSMDIIKATIDPTTSAMRFRMVASDTGYDVFGERMSVELFNDFTSRIEKGTDVPAPYKSILAEKSGWAGGMPYVSLAHFKSGINGNNIPADTERVYVDGEMLKSTAVCRDTPLGRAVFAALKSDADGTSTFEEKIRVSIGFLDLSHSHGDFVFERKGLASLCPMCENGDVNKVYLKGILVHNALTRVPANPRTEAEVEKSMTINTKLDDAASIVGEELASEIVKNKSALDDQDLSDILTVKAVAEPTAADAEEDTKNHPVDCTCKACAGKKKEVKKSEVSTISDVTPVVVAEKTSLDTSFEALKSKIEELKSLPREQALKEIQGAFEAVGNEVQAQFVEEKSIAVTAKIDPELQELLIAMKSSMDGLNSKIGSLTDEVTILKSQISSTAKAQTVTMSEPVRRNIQVDRSVIAGDTNQKPRSILEIARASVQG